ncbi:MAG: LLM class F420-dependent oxidoreductase [Acidimicrobiales bacterium]
MLSPKAWVDVAVAADELGFDSVWIPEHLVLPAEMAGSPFVDSDHPPIPSTVPVFDAFGYLCFLAARTERVRLGTHVFNIGLRHPFVTARAVATLDVLSGGQVDFGVGASWLEAEWRAVGLDFAGRGARVDECLDVCRRLWTEPVVEHHGEHFDFDPVMFEPKPLQLSGPPVHVGGDSPAALRRVASRGDGWIPMNHTIEQIPGALARIAELQAELGRPGPIEVTLSAPVSTAADIEACAAAGVTRVFVSPWESTSGAIEGMRRFSTEFISG